MVQSSEGEERENYGGGSGGHGCDREGKKVVWCENGGEILELGRYL